MCRNSASVRPYITLCTNHLIPRSTVYLRILLLERRNSPVFMEPEIHLHPQKPTLARILCQKNPIHLFTHMSRVFYCPVDCETCQTNDGENIPSRTKRAFYIRTRLVPRSKHSTSVIKTNLLTVYKAKVPPSSEIHTKHINVISMQNF